MSAVLLIGVANSIQDLRMPASFAFYDAQAPHRTSFAPETTSTTRNECDRFRTKAQENQGSRLSPPAQNGLVAGSSPAGPTSLASAREARKAAAPKPTGEGGMLGPRAAARQATHDRQGEACPP